ncbi:MAG: 6-phosphogluconolactonase [Thermoleophilaceae bacterium]|nr:6-phosphogluconolactonase [Thermoleophilaceae bacterium]
MPPDPDPSQTAAPPLVLNHPGRVALLAGELVANRLRARPGLRLILPTGRTPVGMYGVLRDHAADGSLVTGRATLFQLDEYAGLPPDDERSYAAYLARELRGIRFAAVHGLDGSAPDPDAECARHQALLDAAPLDLVVLGLGRDGHVAFDEPGSDLDTDTRRVRLAETTRADAAGDFGVLEAVPREALTVGMRSLAGARELLMLVTGAAKAHALRAMLEDAPGPGSPASLLRTHPRLTIVCDTAAAAELSPQAGWSSDRALIVLGHREPSVSPEHVISEESRARLRLAASECRADPPRAVILTGYSRTGGVSEAEQMKADWSVPGVPALLEDAGRNTSENASRSLPIVRAIGDIRRVTVVTSTWHLRAPFFFRPFPRFGLETSFRFSPRGRWPRMLWHELTQAPAMHRERREAMAAMRLPPEPALPERSGAGGAR